jgi:hypothetical protein
MLNLFMTSINMNSGSQYEFNSNALMGVLPPVFSWAWTPLVRLFQRDWFLRIWVIQEAVMATNVWVQCGTRHVKGEVIVQVSQACQSLGYLGGYTIQNSAAGTHSAAVVDLLKNRREDATLVESLALTRNYGATNLKDRVFVLLGIAVDRDDFDKPKYEGTTIQSVYTSVTKRSLIQHQSLACLSSAGLGSSSLLPDLPTWVPNWAEPNNHQLTMNSKRFLAAGATTPDVKLYDHDTTLCIRGWIIGTF